MSSLLHDFSRDRERGRLRRQFTQNYLQIKAVLRIGLAKVSFFNDFLAQIEKNSAPW
jgi:hypothetical protein